MKRLLVRFGALAAVATLFGLALWSPPVRGDLGGADAARLCRGKIDRLARAINAGGTAQNSFSERELNAHLARLLSRNRAAREARGLTVGIEDLRLDLTGGPTFFVDARLLSTPLVFTLGLTCNTEAGPPRLRAVRVGHLPFVGPLKHLVAGRMKPLFAQLRNESVVWQHLASCEVRELEPTISEPTISEPTIGEPTITVSVNGQSQDMVAAGRP